MGTLCCKEESGGGEEPFTLASGPSGPSRRGWHGLFCRRGHFRGGQRLRGFLQPSSLAPPYLVCYLLRGWRGHILLPAQSGCGRWRRLRAGGELGGGGPVLPKTTVWGLPRGRFSPPREMPSSRIGPSWENRKDEGSAPSRIHPRRFSAVPGPTLRSSSVGIVPGGASPSPLLHPSLAVRPQQSESPGSCKNTTENVGDGNATLGNVCLDLRKALCVSELRGNRPGRHASPHRQVPQKLTAPPDWRTKRSSGHPPCSCRAETLLFLQVCRGQGGFLVAEHGTDFSSRG